MKIHKFTFKLDKNPIPYQNHIRRSKNGGMFKDSILTWYQYQLGVDALNQMIEHGNRDLILDKYKMKIIFYCKDKRHGDLTNIFKSFEDALQNVVYSNDKNLIELNAKIKYDKENPRIECKIIY